MPKKKPQKNPKGESSDEELCKIISTSIADVLRISFNEEFRKKSFELLQVTSTKKAEEKINAKLVALINENPCLRNPVTSTESTNLLSDDGVKPTDLANPSYLNHEFSDFSVLENYDATNGNLLPCTIAYSTMTEVEHQLSAELVQPETNFQNEYESIGTSSGEVCKTCTRVNENLDNNQAEETLEHVNLLVARTRNGSNASSQIANSQAIFTFESQENRESQTLNHEGESIMRSHSQPLPGSENDQSSHSQASSLSQEITEGNWLEISFQTNSKEKWHWRDFEKKKKNHEQIYSLFNSNSLEELDNKITLSNSEDFVEENETFFYSCNASNSRGLIKRGGLNFLETNLKRQKKQDLKLNSWIDLGDADF